MADSISVDMSEVRELAVDMTRVDGRLTRHLAPVVKKGALNIKNQLVSEMSGSRHFGSVARGITYDIKGDGFEAEIGPEKGRPGSLANIAYFGGSNGGGGTVPDPQGAGEAELPNFEKALAEVAEGLIFE